MNKRITILLLVGIISIATFFRFHHFTSAPPGLFTDEAYNGKNALEANHSGDYKVFYDDNFGREGLFINIQALSLKFFGVTEPWALRFPSPVVGILTVLGLYFLARELFSERAALFASFFLAVSFWHINFSRIGFRAIMAPLFLTWGLYFLLLTFRKIRENPPHLLLPTFYSLLTGILYGLGFHTYIAYRATPAVFGIISIYWFMQARREGWLKRFCVVIVSFFLATAIVALPLFIYFATHSGSFFGRTSAVSIFATPHPTLELLYNTIATLGMFNFLGDFNWRHNFAGHPELSIPVGIFFAIGIFLGIKTVVRKLRRSVVQTPDDENKNFSIATVFLIFFVTALPVVISSEGIPHALRAILMIPAVFLLAGFGAAYAYNKLATKYELDKRMRKIFLIACHILLIALIFETYFTYFILWANKPHVQTSFNADYLKLAHAINQLPTDTEKYVIVETRGKPDADPIPPTTVAFVTNTFTKADQAARHVHYISPKDAKAIPEGAHTFHLAQ